MANKGACQTPEILFSLLLPLQGEMKSLRQLPCAAERGENHPVGPSACPRQRVVEASLAIPSGAEEQEDSSSPALCILVIRVSQMDASRGLFW